jgi:hypothetical protein
MSIPAESGVTKERFVLGNVRRDVQRVGKARFLG